MSTYEFVIIFARVGFCIR